MQTPFINSSSLPERIISSDDDEKIIGYARSLVIVTAFLLFFGLTMLYSTSYGVAGAKYFKNQLIWSVTGCGMAFLCYNFGYKKLGEWSKPLLIITWILLLCALFGPKINGAHRWISIKLPGMSMNLQPSELAKVVLAIYLADFCAKNFRTIPLLFNANGLWRPGMTALVIMATIMAGHDFGTTALIGVMVVFVLLAAGMPFRYILIPLGLAFAVALYIYFFDAMRLARVTSFLDPNTYKTDSGYQLWMSLLALGSGGWRGQGFMASRMKAKYLPEAHTDFILSIIGEELGFLTMLFFVILFYGLFCYFALRISLGAKSKMGALLGFGLTTFIIVQAMINISVIAGLAPTKGMPAPFISYGGSNLLACLTSVGILLSIAAESVNPEYNKKFLDKFDAIKKKISEKASKLKVRQ